MTVAALEKQEIVGSKCLGSATSIEKLSMCDRLSMNLPDKLKRSDRKQYLLWRYEPDPAGKKPRKIPYYTNGQRRNGIQGEPPDLAKMATFAETLAALEAGDYDGIGIAMLPGAGLVGVDLDDHFADGSIKPEVAPLVAGTYSEISPSGRGIRAFFLGEYQDRKHLQAGVEIFCGKGFLTVTGDRLTPDDIAPLPDAVRVKLDALFASQRDKSSRGERLGDTESNDPIYQRLVERGMVRQNFGGGRIGITCPFESEHTTGDGDADCCYFLPHTNGYESGNFHCLHAHCAERSQEDFRRAIGIEDGVGKQPLRLAEEKPKACVVRACELTPEPIEWLWPGYLAAGKVHTFAGAAGIGKTRCGVAIGATITVGGRFPDGTRSPVGDVAIWSGEDDPADTLLPRLMADGADLNRVHIIQAVIEGGEKRSFDPSKDIPTLEPILASNPIKLLIVDPVVSAVAGDSHKNAEVRRALQPLVDLAERFKCAVVGVTHFSKGTRSRDPLERVTGSIAFGALARMVWAAIRPSDDEQNKGARLFARVKSNIGPDGGGFKYYLEETRLESHPGVVTTRFLWGEAVEGTAKALFDMAEAEDENRTATDEAMEWLGDILANGPMAAKEIQKQAGQVGFSKKVIRLARQKLKIKPVKSSFTNGWEWSLPEDAPKMPQHPGRAPSQESHTQHIDNNIYLRRCPEDALGTFEDALNPEDALVVSGAPSQNGGTFDETDEVIL